MRKNYILSLISSLNRQTSSYLDCMMAPSSATDALRFLFGQFHLVRMLLAIALTGKGVTSMRTKFREYCFGQNFALPYNLHHFRNFECVFIACFKSTLEPNGNGLSLYRVTQNKGPNAICYRIISKRRQKCFERCSVAKRLAYTVSIFAIFFGTANFANQDFEEYGKPEILKSCQSRGSIYKHLRSSKQ